MKLEYFNMIDKVVRLNESQDEIVCRSTLPVESPIFDGHFPTLPILPGVLMTEIIAQACGYLSIIRSEFTRMSFLAGIEGARFRDFLHPGQELEIHAKLIRAGSGYSVYEGSIKTTEKRVANCQIRLCDMAFLAPEIKAMMTARLRAAGVETEISEII